LAIFKYERPHGGVVAFNLEVLIDYILATGDFLDPETRQPFSDDALRDMDKAAEKAGLQKNSVLACKNQPQLFAEARFRRDALAGLERLAGEVVAGILHLIETSDPHEAQMRLLMRELPAFSDYYSQLHAADPLYASQCLLHWQAFITGPPNRPNDDHHGLIACVLAFLEQCKEDPGHFGLHADVD